VWIGAVDEPKQAGESCVDDLSDRGGAGHSDPDAASASSSTVSTTSAIEPHIWRREKVQPCMPAEKAR
jgi:hypothetical protein